MTFLQTKNQNRWDPVSDRRRWLMELMALKVPMASNADLVCLSSKYCASSSFSSFFFLHLLNCNGKGAATPSITTTTSTWTKYSTFDRLPSFIISTYSMLHVTYIYVCVSYVHPLLLCLRPFQTRVPRMPFPFTLSLLACTGVPEGLHLFYFIYFNATRVCTRI